MSIPHSVLGVLSDSLRLRNILDLIEYQPFDDGWGDYQEPSITLQ